MNSESFLFIFRDSLHFDLFSISYSANERHSTGTLSVNGVSLLNAMISQYPFKIFVTVNGRNALNRLSAFNKTTEPTFKSPIFIFLKLIIVIH